MRSEIDRGRLPMAGENITDDPAGESCKESLGLSLISHARNSPACIVVERDSKARSRTLAESNVRVARRGHLPLVSTRPTWCRAACTRVPLWCQSAWMEGTTGEI